MTTTSSSPSFVGVHLTVNDMAASIAFYRRIGLEVPEPVGGGTHAEIDLGNGMRLALSTPEVTRMYDAGWREPHSPPAGALQFNLSSREAVDTLFAELVAAGDHGHLPPVDAFWGNRYAEVDDPDGNMVGFHGQSAP